MVITVKVKILSNCCEYIITIIIIIIIIIVKAKTL